MILTAPAVTELHDPGVFQAVCVDIVDLGRETIESNGKSRCVQRVRFVFETESPGSVRFISRKFSATLHPNSALNEFLSKWRGRAIIPGDTVNLDNCLGASATLVISHQPRRDGQGLYACIDAISRPTKKVTPSGAYDPGAYRQQSGQRSAVGAGLPSNPARPGTPASPIPPEEDDIPF